MGLETERLRMRQWQARDREPFAAMNSDPRVMEFFPAMLDRAASDALADRAEAAIARRGWGMWAVELRETSGFMGFIGLSVPAVELPFSPCVEVGWRLAFPYWGRGFASEGARAALRVGFEELGLAEIVSFTAVGNERSRAVMRRIGMRESEGTFEHPSVPAGHALREHCLYRVLRAEWEARKA